MQLFGCSPFVILFSYPPVLVPIFWWLYRAFQLQLAWLSFSCSIIFSVLLQGLGTRLFAFFQFCPVGSRNVKVYISAVSFLLTITRSGCLVKIRWSVYIAISQRTVYLIHPDWFWVLHIPLEQVDLSLFWEIWYDFHDERWGLAL